MVERGGRTRIVGEDAIARGVGLQKVEPHFNAGSSNSRPERYIATLTHISTLGTWIFACSSSEPSERPPFRLLLGIFPVQGISQKESD